MVFLGVGLWKGYWMVCGGIYVVCSKEVFLIVSLVRECIVNLNIVFGME